MTVLIGKTPTIKRVYRVNPYMDIELDFEDHDEVTALLQDPANRELYGEGFPDMASIDALDVIEGVSRSFQVVVWNTRCNGYEWLTAFDEARRGVEEHYKRRSLPLWLRHMQGVKLAYREYMKPICGAYIDGTMASGRCQQPVANVGDQCWHHGGEQG